MKSKGLPLLEAAWLPLLGAVGSLRVASLRSSRSTGSAALSSFLGLPTCTHADLVDLLHLTVWGADGMGPPA